MVGLPDSVPEQPDHPGWHFDPDGQVRRDGVDLPPPAADDAMLYTPVGILGWSDAIAGADGCAESVPAQMRSPVFHSSASDWDRRHCSKRR